MTLTQLRQKWKPILEVREVIPQEEIEQYKKDVEKYKRDNPDWQVNTTLI